MMVRTGEWVMWLSKVIRLGAVGNTAKNVVAFDLLTFLVGLLDSQVSTYTGNKLLLQMFLRFSEGIFWKMDFVL